MEVKPTLKTKIEDSSAETDTIKPKRKLQNTSQEADDAVKEPKKIVKKRKPTRWGEKTQEVIIEINSDEDDRYIIEPKNGVKKLPDDILDMDEVGLLVNFSNTPPDVAKNFVSLLNKGCTLPFISRYRKDAMKHLPPDCIQDLYEWYQYACEFKKKVQYVLEVIKKNKKLTQDIGESIMKTKSPSELELIYEPLMSPTKSLAERARRLGLESHAVTALNSFDDLFDLKELCDNTNEELATLDKVESHLTHLVADIIYKDPRVMQYIRETSIQLKTDRTCIIKSKQIKSSQKVKEEDDKKNMIRYNPKTDPATYKYYFDWMCPVKCIQSHQTLAINRGENEKILKVKIIPPNWFYDKLEIYCLCLWRSSYWVRKGLHDAFCHLIKPLITRQIRSELNLAAQKEAIRTFTTNLETFLLTEPIKNRRIAGLDPGYTAGCKVGIIESNGEKLAAFTIFPSWKQENSNDVEAQKLKLILMQFGVQLIGLGNGNGCLETEQWLKYHRISEQFPVVIVPEQGTSIYSFSKEAQKEHPNMAPNLISALSIARRVLDPLGELIKVDPKHLGIGLYQHDIPTNMLASALNNTVEKVVSLVGVDINTASRATLRRISGLNDRRAKRIIEYRLEHIRFTSREEILNVTGIDKVTYQQCAGFLKVLGGTEPLDTTIIHPESYEVAKLFAKKIGLDVKHLTESFFPELVGNRIKGIDIPSMCQELNTDIYTLYLIINAFKQKPYEDNVITFCRPVYSVAVQATDKIVIGTILTGVVRNVVPFGCFVDCGHWKYGLIHRTDLRNHKLKLGDRVEVTVIEYNLPRRIKFLLNRILD